MEGEDNTTIQQQAPEEKYTILTQSEEEFQRQMRSLNTLNFDSMVEMTLNEDLLKNNFKTITEILKKQYGLINMCTQNIDQLGKDRDADSRLDELAQGQSDLRDLVNKLLKDNESNKSALAALQGSDSGKDMEGLASKGDALEKRTDDLEALLKQLQEQLNKLAEQGSHGEDIQKLFDLLDQLRKRQSELGAGQKDAGADKDLQAELESLRAAVDRVKDQLLDKVDCEDYDNMINQLKAQLVSMQGGQPVVQQVIEVPRSRDGNKLGQLETRVKLLEDQSKESTSTLSILSDQAKQQALSDEEQKAKLEDYFKAQEEKNGALSTDLTKLQERVKMVEDYKADKTDLKKAQEEKDKLKRDLMEVINKVKESVATNAQKIEVNTTDIDDLKRKQESANKKFNELQRKAQQQGNQADLTKVQALVDSAFNALKAELAATAKKLQDQLDKKDFEEDMLAYQQKIFQKIDEIVGALIKKLANKEDTKKALGYLEKKIADLYLMVNPDNKDKEQDGLLVKRPLFWSCVSCDKDLEQYQGRLGDYKNWKVFPPKETSPERMGRFGVGYAQMMQNRKANIDKEKQVIQEKDQNQQTATNTNTQNFKESQGTGFPEIPTKDSNKQYRKN